MTDYPDYIISLLGEELPEFHGSVSPPIFATSNFFYSSSDDMQKALENESTTPFYSRGVNPTLALLSKKMAALEHTEQALIFSSGSAAIAAGIMAQVGQGDHIVCIEKPYSWTKYLLSEYLPRFGVSHTFVKGIEASEYESATQENTRLYILESPNSWTFEMQDVAAIAKLARKKGIKTLIDNSYNSPLHFTPADYGIDLVAHSATKYISGHSDVVAGILCCSQEDYDLIFRQEFMAIGSVASPFSAWLLLRGLRTLSLRMEKSAAQGKALYEFLKAHPAVAEVYYPGHHNDRQKELSDHYLKGISGMLSFTLVEQDPTKIRRFVDNLELFRLACSWGGYESLAFPAIVLPTSANYQKAPFPPNMIRISPGVEEIDLLKRDLDHAFDKIKN